MRARRSRLDAVTFAGMIARMAEAPPPARRIQPATIALAAAALIAAGVLVYTLAFRGDGSGAAGNATAAANAAQPVTEAQIAEARAAASQARIAELTEALRRDPDNHQAWYELGGLYRELDRASEAGQAFRRAMELQPANAAYTNYVGEMLL